MSAESFAQTMELLRAAQEGDAASLSQLVERYRPRLLARVRHLLSPGVRRWAESTDFTQIVLLDFLENLERFQPRDERSLQHWLSVVARNAIRDEARRKHQRGVDTVVGPSAPPPAASAAAGARQETPADDAEAREQSERLRTMIAALPPDMRSVVEMRQFEGLSFAAIGDRLGRSENAVQLLHARALRRLGGLLGDA